MRFAKLVGAAALATLVMGAPATLSADEMDLKAVARATAAKSAKAVVTVKLVVELRLGGAGGGRAQEEKLEVIGTVIDSSGLTVVSASAVEPSSLLGGFGGGRRRGGGGGGGGGGEEMRIESEVLDTAIVLDDGTEIEADVVLKDKDLDLAFIRPREAQKLDAVELAPRGRALELLEDVFTVTRLGRGDNRAIAVSVGSVKAVVKGPRSYAICTPEVASGSLGCIAYAANGAPVGIFVLKVQSGGEGGFGRGRDIASIVRPIEDLLEIAKQAKEAKAPERKTEKAAPADEKPADAPASGGDKPAEPPTSTPAPK